MTNETGVEKKRVVVFETGNQTTITALRIEQHY